VTPEAAALLDLLAAAVRAVRPATWLRAARRRAKSVRACATMWACALDRELGAVTPAGSELGDAVEALGIAAHAWTLRWVRLQWSDLEGVSQRVRKSLQRKASPLAASPEASRRFLPGRAAYRGVGYPRCRRWHRDRHASPHSNNVRYRSLAASDVG
jgi:hypothetical protein